LAKAFFETGHEVVETHQTADISLVFIEPTGRKLSEKVVQRLDGIWFKPSEFKTKNTNIKKCYDNANAIVWQSEFDKTFVTKMFGQKDGAVIRNGVHQEKCQKFTIGALEQIRNAYKLVFCCSANWHPQKRLNDNINLFKHIRQNIEPSSALIVLGSNPTFVADKDIFFAGSQPHDVCNEVYSASNWMIHLAYLDHCPNVVCEALNQSTPVICSSDGGTKELVKDFGIIIKEQTDFQYELFDYDNPPEIDIKQLTTLPNKNSLGAHENIDIHYCAQQYIDLFKKVLMV